jgi:tetratricopeptide (TPR) repeat protein
MPSFETKQRLKAKILEINKTAMEFLQEKRYDKCLKSIDKANHLIEFQFPYNKNSIAGKSIVSYIDLVYRFQLVSITYNNCACLYKQKNKLMHALKCLYQALKADKDLIRLFQKISEIRVNRKFASGTDEKQLDDLKMKNNNRNDFASTYLNICAVLSLMENHDKALHMSQKAVEMITSQAITKHYTIDDFLDNLIGGDKTSLTEELKAILITLAASYYNKAVELDFMHNTNAPNKEYLGMAWDAIESATKVAQRIPGDIKITLKDEIAKLSSKLEYKKTGTFGLGSRGSSRKSSNRVNSPPAYGTRVRETNMSDLKKYFDTTPKSFDTNTKPTHMERWSPGSDSFGKSGRVYIKANDRNVYPIYKRSLNNGSDKGNKTDFFNNSSPFDSDSNLEHDDSSAKLSDSSIPRPAADHPYFNRRNGGKHNAQRMVIKKHRGIGSINKKVPAQHDLPTIQKNTNPKTSYDLKPIVEKNKSMINGRTTKLDRNSVPERYYAFDESELLQEYQGKSNKVNNRVSCLKL